MASAGIGSGNHLFGELPKIMTGIELLHVTYRRRPALVDLMAGQAQVMFASVSVLRVRQGRQWRARGDRELDLPAEGHPLVADVAGLRDELLAGLVARRGRRPRSSTGSTARSMRG